MRRIIWVKEAAADKLALSNSFECMRQEEATGNDLNLASTQGSTMNETDIPIKHVRSNLVFAPIINEYEVTHSERLNALLAEEITKWKEMEPGITRSNISGWHSDGNIFKREEPGLREICKYFIEACKPIIERYLPRERLDGVTLQFEGWANINPPHSYNAMHSHGSYDLSGVYFVRIPRPSHRLSGALQFLNPSYRYGPYSDLFQAMNPQEFTVSPVAGKMLIFPSAMPHCVLPNDEDEDRISIAFNLKLK
jgi:uncharacterized protein (TIGR02466 family)